MCAQLSFGIRRAFIGREYSAREIRDIDRRINMQTQKLQWPGEMLWLVSDAGRTIKDKVSIKGERLEGTEIFTATIGRYSCAFGITCFSKLPCRSYPPKDQRQSETAYNSKQTPYKLLLTPSSMLT
jgi:hypothetical protein